MFLMRMLLSCSLVAACGDGAARGADSAPVVAIATGSSKIVMGRFDWWLDLVNRRHGAMAPGEASVRLHRSYRAEQVERHFRAIAGKYAPLTFLGVEEADAGHLIADVDSPVGRLRINLNVDREDGKIREVLVRPRLAASMQEIAGRVRALAPQTQFLVAEVVGGVCRPMHAEHADRPFPLASVFKLYVLLALVDRVVAGELSWDAPLAIRDDWKSLSSGTMQDLPAGTTLPLRAFARRMIRDSDNTAADHLLHTVGRERVEAAVRASGHSEPALNVPLLSTREVFLFWHLRPEVGESQGSCRLKFTRRCSAAQSERIRAPG